MVIAKIQASKKPPFSRTKYTSQEAAFHKTLTEFYKSFLSQTSASSHQNSAINSTKMSQVFETGIRAYVISLQNNKSDERVRGRNTLDAKMATLLSYCISRFRVLLVELAAEIELGRKKLERRSSESNNQYATTAATGSASASAAANESLVEQKADDKATNKPSTSKIKEARERFERDSQDSDKDKADKENRNNANNLVVPAIGNVEEKKKLVSYM